MIPHTSLSSRHKQDAPRILYLPHGDVVLCEHSYDGLRLTHSATGQTAELRGSFSLHLEQFLAGKSDKTGLGALTVQHPWLGELNHAGTVPSAAHILLGKGLRMLFIELTNRCNESCIHCYAESTPECSGRLELDEIEAVLKAARAFGNPAVQLTGGDPLIHPDIVEAAAAARDLGYKTLEIYTNGLSLNDAMLKRLLPYKPNFAFSMYSHDATVHDAITQVPGSHARTLAAIRRTQDAGLAVRIGIVLMPENKGQETDIVNFLQNELSLSAHQIGIDVVRSTGRGRFMWNYQPDLTGLRSFGHRPDMPEMTPAETNAPASPVGHRGKLCVCSNGNIYPCIFSRQTLLGNIRCQTLTEIVQSLDRRKLPSPSAKRWKQCRQGLSCSDCQAIAYALGPVSAPQGGMNAVA